MPSKTAEDIRGRFLGWQLHGMHKLQQQISTLKRTSYSPALFDISFWLLFWFLCFPVILNDHVQIEEEQWWDIDRDEVPADRPVYQDFN